MDVLPYRVFVFVFLISEKESALSELNKPFIEPFRISLIYVLFFLECSFACVSVLFFIIIIQFLKLNYFMQILIHNC